MITFQILMNFLKNRFILISIRIRRFWFGSLEAIENNVAVVCSNISPLNEFVENVSGCLVDRTVLK